MGESHFPLSTPHPYLPAVPAEKERLHICCFSRYRVFWQQKGAMNMNELTYTVQGDYRLPNLLPPQEPEVTLGKYGLLRRKYLQQHRRVTYTNLLTSGRLTADLMEIEQTARSRIEQLIVQMAKSEGVTEELKATDQMKWVGLMNSVRQAAEEIVLSELVFS